MSTKISNEIEQVAEKMEKSATEFATIRKTILTLGAEGLKKALPNLSDPQKDLLKAVLKDMAKSHDKPVKNAKYSPEPKTNTTPNGDYVWNEAKIPQDYQDETIYREVEEDEAEKHRNQGGVPVEGWEGQIIKSDGDNMLEDEKELKKKQGVPKGVDPDKHERCVKDVKKQGHDKSSAYAICNSSMKKSEFTAMIVRMQERELEKATCVSKLSERYSLEKSKIEVVWDALEKATSYKYDDSTTGKDLDEADQSKQPEDKKAAKPTGDEPDVPVSKTLPRGETDEAKNHKTTADAGQKPPLTKAEKEEPGEKEEEKKEEETGKKIAEAIDDMAEGEAEESMKEHEKEMHGKDDEKKKMKKSEDLNPFTHRKIGQNAHYRVDEYNARQYVENMKKSTFDWEDTENFEEMKKAGGEGSRGGKVIGHTSSGKLKKSYDVNDLIAAEADMDSTLLKSAQDVFIAKDTETAFLVKSFDDSDMDGLFDEQDMYRKK